MASVTLAESAKLSQNMLVAGVIESVITVNPFFELLPFQGIEGNALAYNRENALGDVMSAGIGDTITAKAAATFTAITSSLTTLIGDAEVNGLIQATRSNFTSQKAVQIASKAKSIGRKYQDQMINGAGSGADMTGLLSLLPGAQIVATATNGSNLSFALLDELLDTVKDKDGQVDFIQMPARTIRAYYALLRALGGATMNEAATLPSGKVVPAYRGVPIFRNDWIPVNQTQAGSGAVCTTVLAGTIDDGSMTHGIAGLTAMDEAGIRIQEVGVMEAKDESITRVKWYCGLALFSDKGLAGITGVLN